MSDSASKPRINPWSIGLIIAMMLGGLVVYYNYLQELQRQKQDDRPAYYSALKTNLEAVDQSGEEVSLAQLKGKVYLCNYIFTRCPEQCSGVAAIMEEHLAEYRGHPLFHMVSVSLDPAHDTPADMQAFAKRHGLESEQWWFLTGDESKIRKYMSNYFKFKVKDKPIETRDNDSDLFLHEPLIALVDHKARIRGLYRVYGPREKENREHLKKDLASVMNEAMEDTPVESVAQAKGWPITADIDLVKQDGGAVKFSDLKGKVSVVSHVFTRCPAQCPGICAIVNDIRKELGGDPRFMAASLTMDPAYDTPEVLTKFAETHELVADNWWFLTGETEPIVDFMANQLQFGQELKPEAERTVPTDLYKHDFKLNLLNHELKVIDRYDALEESDVARLKADIKRALEAAPAAE